MPDTRQVRLRELFIGGVRPDDTHPGYRWTAATARELLADLRRLHERRRDAADSEREPLDEADRHEVDTCLPALAAVLSQFE